MTWTLTHDGHELIARFVDGGIPRRVNAYDGFTRALWLPYVEPPDPFAEPVPSLRERVEALPDVVLGSGRVIVGAVDRGAVLALLEKESQ